MEIEADQKSETTEQKISDLKNNPQTSEVVKLIELGCKCCNNDLKLKEANRYFKKAIKVIGDPKENPELSKLLARAYILIGKVFVVARFNFHIPIFDKGNLSISSTISDKSNYSEQAKYVGRCVASSIYYLDKGIKIFETCTNVEDFEFLFDAYIKLGESYGIMSKIDREIICFEKAIDILEKLGKKDFNFVEICRIIASDYCLEKNSDQAIIWYEKGLSVATPLLTSEKDISEENKRLVEDMKNIVAYRKSIKNRDESINQVASS